MIGNNASGFLIYDDCNISKYSSSWLGDYGYFELPQGIQFGWNEAYSYLAGSWLFKVVEIEIFKMAWKK